MTWLKNKIVYILVALGILGIAYGATLEKPIPEHLQLKVSVDKIIYSEEKPDIRFNFETGEVENHGMKVKYMYVTDEKPGLFTSDILTEQDKKEHNIKTRLTETSRDFNKISFEHNGKTTDVIYPGVQMVRKNGEWFYVDWATTTPEVFNKISLGTGYYPDYATIQKAYAQDTYYPDGASYEDGRVYQNYGNGNGVAWATLEAAAGTNVDDDEHYYPIANAWKDPDNLTLWAGNVRASYAFYTNIDNTHTVTAATFSVYGEATWYTDVDNLDPTYNVFLSQPAAANNLVAGDYDGFDRTTPFSDTDIAHDSWSTSAYNNWTLNSDGRSAVALDNTDPSGVGNGITVFGIVESKYDAGDSTPTADGNGTYWEIGGWYAEEEGTTKDPKLVVTHSVVAAEAPITSENIILFGEW